MSAVVHDHVMSNERASDFTWKKSTDAGRINYNNCLDLHSVFHFMDLHCGDLTPCLSKKFQDLE